MRTNVPSKAQVRGWKITPPAMDEPAARPAVSTGPVTDTELRHGYNLADVDNLARAAAHTNRWYRGADVADRVDTARFAIIEHLLTAKQPPERNDLLRSALHAADQYVRDEMSAHGRQRAVRGGGTIAAFERYWWTVAANMPSPENRIVEKAALYEILPMLTRRELEALTLLAALGNYQAGADAMGVAYSTFVKAVNDARRSFRTWWHEGETPSGPWRMDKRVHSHTSALATHCSKGHEYTPENTYRYPDTIRRRGRRQCRTCMAGYRPNTQGDSDV